MCDKGCWKLLKSAAQAILEETVSQCCRTYTPTPPNASFLASSLLMETALLSIPDAGMVELVIFAHGAGSGFAREHMLAQFVLAARAAASLPEGTCSPILLFPVRGYGGAAPMTTHRP